MLAHNCLGPSLAGAWLVFVTPETYPTTFVNGIFWFDEIFWPPPQGPSQGRLDPQGSESDPEWIFVTLKIYLTTFVSKIFWLDEIWFWPPSDPATPVSPVTPRGQGSTSNSLFPAPMHEHLTLPIWFGYYKQFPRSFADDPVTDRNQRVNIYLIQLWGTGLNHWGSLLWTPATVHGRVD